MFTLNFRPLCGKSRKCSKSKGHRGKCNKERKFHDFWSSSAPQKRNQLVEVEKRVQSLMTESREKGKTITNILSIYLTLKEKVQSRIYNTNNTNVRSGQLEFAKSNS